MNDEKILPRISAFALSPRWVRRRLASWAVASLVGRSCMHFAWLVHEQQKWGRPTAYSAITACQISWNVIFSIGPVGNAIGASKNRAVQPCDGATLKRNCCCRCCTCISSAGYCGWSGLFGHPCQPEMLLAVAECDCGVAQSPHLQASCLALQLQLRSRDGGFPAGDRNIHKACREWLPTDLRMYRAERLCPKTLALPVQARV
jgi:hypothetical protein